MKRINLLLLCLVLTGCTNTYCPPKEADVAIQELQEISERWIDAFDIARLTPRYSLGPQIALFQEYKSDANALEVPECLKNAQYHLVRSMEEGIDGFILFIGQAPEMEVYTKLSSVSFYILATMDAISNVEACLPNCRPA